MMGIWTMDTDSPGKNMCPTDMYPSLQASLSAFFHQAPSGGVLLLTH